MDLQEHQEKKAFVLNIVLLMVVFSLKTVPGDDFTDMLQHSLH
uniref:Uncharacterized protein n=1 Tax=Onchocerca volvulus TaxID=6282 RepID=A0A8R1TNP2_ONCVO